MQAVKEKKCDVPKSGSQGGKNAISHASLNKKKSMTLRVKVIK
jgi:hypothetical protein